MKQLTLLFLILLAVPTFGQSRRTRDLRTFARAERYRLAIIAAATRYRIDPRLLWTIAYLETRFQPQLVSPKGARGLMQFIPETGRRYGLLKITDFHDPVRSIDAAALYVRDLSTMFGGRVDLVLAGYNAGENAVIRYGYRVPPYRETLNYVSKGVAIFRGLGASKVFSLTTNPPLNRAGHSFSFTPQPSQTSRSIYFSTF